MNHINKMQGQVNLAFSTIMSLSVFRKLVTHEYWCPQWSIFIHLSALCLSYLEVEETPWTHPLWFMSNVENCIIWFRELLETCLDNATRHVIA